MIELYEHNEEAYLNMQEMHKYENKVAIVHPTGTGKMYIAVKWLYENRDKSCLFLCPTKAIMYQLKNTIESCGLKLNDFPNLKLALYRNLLNWNTEDYQKHYDCIVLDEFHRAGAPLWGECVNTLLEYNKDAKVLREIIECMDKCSAKGIKVYIAAGNKSDNYFNLYTLADNAFVVGAINKYGSLQTFSARNSLVNRYARGVYRVKTVKDSNGHVIGFDINDDKKRDVSILKTTAKNKIPSVLPIRGTSFATPNAIVCDFQRVFVD